MTSTAAICGFAPVNGLGIYSRLSIGRNAMFKETSAENIVASPFTALFVSFLFGAAAFSGKFAVTGTRICLVLAWVVLLVPLRAQIWQIRLGAGFAGAIVLLLLGAWLRPVAVPGYFGIQKSKSKTLFSAKDATERKIQIGDSETFIVYVGHPGTPLFDFFDGSSLTIELIKGHVAVSTQIHDSSGDLVAELIRNEWKVAHPPKTFDRNYTDDALEVRNPQGRIILQIKALPDRIQLQGEWWNSSGIGIRIVKNPFPGAGAMFVYLDAQSNLSLGPILPMFQYPSESHFGQLATP
jgi:hypothetical protein